MGDGGDRVCELECVTGEKPRRTDKHEFVGPVKIILVDPIPGDYQRKVWGSAAIHVANLYMGFNILIILVFTLCFRMPLVANTHVAVCTIGFQLFMPSAIIMLNPLFGAATPLKVADRRFQHLFLQYFSLIGFGGGAAMFLTDTNPFFVMGPHNMTGIAAMGCGAMAMLLGPLVYFISPPKGGHPLSVKNIHLGFGIISFLSSSLCFCSGLFKPSFVKWSDRLGLGDLPFVCTVLCFYYTVVVFLSISWRSKVDT